MSSHDAIQNDGQQLSWELASEPYILAQSNSPTVHPLLQTIHLVARTKIPVLLSGESGTGKETIAWQIHQLSRRSGEGLVKTICASCDGDILAGYYKRNGKVASDDGPRPGTLFLKEVSELGARAQTAMLYAFPEVNLQAEQTTPGPRLISSTTKNLDQEVRAGRFRAELFYRINGISLHIPPLRERKEDIPALTELFLTKHSALLNLPRPQFDLQDLALLQNHSWPGNIRELENVVRQVVALNATKAVLSELLNASVKPQSVRHAVTGSVLKDATREASRRAERQLILDALEKTRWNRKRAAQALQISYKSLLYKLKEIEIGEEDGESV